MEMQGRYRGDIGRYSGDIVERQLAALEEQRPAGTFNLTLTLTPTFTLALTPTLTLTLTLLLLALEPRLQVGDLRLRALVLGPQLLQLARLRVRLLLQRVG